MNNCVRCLTNPVEDGNLVGLCASCILEVATIKQAKADSEIHANKMAYDKEHLDNKE